MADSKSPKKAAPAGVPLFEVSFVSFLVIIILVSFLISRYYPGPVVEKVQGVAENIWLLLPDYTVAVMLRIFTFSFVLSSILIIIVVLLIRTMSQHRKKLNDGMRFVDQEVVETVVTASAPVPVVNEKWQNVLVHINSENQSDWKLAILECDIMLGDLLEKMGYMQESIGEKLKVIEPSDFTSIEYAWEAHKIRNAIAHDGSEFLINDREAKRVIGLYEAVFREFEYI
jgi:hypothetical protein